MRIILKADSAVSSAKTGETGKVSAQVYGTEWNDESYALLLGNKGEIDTSKHINWSSAGDKELTQEQIGYLKEKYDIENLSPQQQYDLVADLTNMGVFSPEDCVSLHVIHTPERAMCGGFFSEPAKGNFLKSIKSCYNADSNMLGLLKNPIFYRGNPDLIGRKDELEAFYEESRARNEKIMNVFQQLKRS